MMQSCSWNLQRLQHSQNINMDDLLGLCFCYRWFVVGKSIRPIKIEWWGFCLVICLEWGAGSLHMVWSVPLPSQTPIISCLIKIQNGFYLSGSILHRLSCRKVVLCVFYWQSVGYWCRLINFWRLSISCCCLIGMEQFAICDSSSSHSIFFNKFHKI